MLCERNLNQMKGRIFNLDQLAVQPTQPIALNDTFLPLLERMLAGDITAQNQMFEHLRMVIAVFRYINHPDALAVIQNNRRQLQAAADTIGTQVTALRDMAAIHREFNINWYRRAADLARTWMTDRLIDIIAAFNLAANVNPPRLPPNWRSVNETLQEIYGQLHHIQPPPEP
jgi:hypothetical protein